MTGIEARMDPCLIQVLDLGFLSFSSPPGLPLQQLLSDSGNHSCALGSMCFSYINPLNLHSACDCGL